MGNQEKPPALAVGSNHAPETIKPSIGDKKPKPYVQRFGYLYWHQPALGLYVRCDVPKTRVREMERAQTERATAQMLPFQKKML